MTDLGGSGLRVFCAALGLLLLAGASGLAQDESYKLEYKFTPGQRDAYKISGSGTMTLSIEGREPTEGKATVELHAIRYVRKVEGSGRTSYAVLVSPGKAEVMGSEQEFARQVGPTITIEPTGKVVKIEPEESSSVGFELTRLKEILEYPVVMPAEEIEVGDSWETESSSGLRITNTLAKIVKVDDLDCAVVETKVAGAIHDAPATVPAPEGPVKLDVSVSNEMTGTYELETGRLLGSEGVVAIEAKGTRQDDGVPFELKMTLNVEVKQPEPNPRTPEAKAQPQSQKPKQGPVSVDIGGLKKKKND